MKREEWLRSLKVGDKVCIICNEPESRHLLRLVTHVEKFRGGKIDGGFIYVDVLNRFYRGNGVFVEGGGFFGAKRIEPCTQEEEDKINAHLLVLYSQKVALRLGNSNTSVVSSEDLNNMSEDRIKVLAALARERDMHTIALEVMGVI